MDPNEELITRFYTAFQQKDTATMAACYHPDATFSDPAFDLKSGHDAGKMWEMLCRRGKDLRVEFRDVKSVSEHRVTAHWDAYYTFSKTGRKVYNSIDATFILRDGLIVEHRDHFDFYRWSKQALGFPAVLFGRMGFFRRKVQATAMDGLRVYMEKG